MYTKEIVIQRWHKLYNITCYQPVDQTATDTNGVTFVPRVPQASQKPLSAASKFRKLQDKTKELMKVLNSSGSDCGTRLYYQRLQLLEDLGNAWQSGTEVVLVQLPGDNPDQGNHNYVVLNIVTYISLNICRH